MDIILQQAIDRARKEELAGNFIGIVKALTGAFEDCEPESEMYLCFELGKYYFAYGDSDSCIKMFARALSGGFSKDAIDVFVLRNFYDRAGMEATYSHNQEVLRQYYHFRTKRLPKIADLHEFYLYSNNVCSVVIDNDRKLEFIETDVKDDIEQIEDVVIFLLQETSPGTMIWLEAQSRKSQKRKTPFYVYFDNEEKFWSMMTCMDIDSFLEEKRVVFFFSKAEVEEYFSDTQTLLPDKIIDRTDQKIGEGLIQAVGANREKRMQKAYEHVNKYYKENKDIIYSSLLDNKIKMFFYTTRFDQVVAQYVNNFIAAGGMLKYSVASITEKSEFSSNGLAEYTMIERLQPNIIFAVNAFRFDKERLPKEVLFLTLLHDVSAESMDNYKSQMTDNDYIMAPGNVCKTVYSSGISKAQVIEMPMLLTDPAIDRIALKHVMYASDVCFFADVVNPVKLLGDIVIQEIQNSHDNGDLKAEFNTAIKEINHMYLNLFYTENIPFTLESTIEVIAPVFAKEAINLSSEELERVADRVRHEFCQQMFVINLATGLVRGGIKHLRLWGSGWADIPQLAHYCIGSINDDIALTKILANAKVVVGSNLEEPDFANIYNTIQCGGVYIENGYMDKKSKIKTILNLNADSDIIYFSSKAEFLQKVRECLADEQLCGRVNTSAKNNIRVSGAYKNTLEMAVEKIRKNISENRG